MEINQRKPDAAKEELPSPQSTPRRKKVSPVSIRVLLLAALLVAGLILIGWSYTYLYATVHMKDHKHLGTSHCPACFGQSLCPSFTRGEVDLKGIFRIPALHQFNERNVFQGYHGLFKNRQDIILKKLARDEYLSSVDSSICSRDRLRKHLPCSPRTRIYELLHRDGNIPLLLKDMVATGADLTYCASPRLKERILKKFREKSSPNSEDYLRFDELILLYTLLVNPHPIIAQTFPKDEGWPTPRYLGACGRWIVEEDAGQPLTEFYKAPLWLRVKLAVQLLELAKRLTRNSDKFSLYMGDPSWSNFVVDTKSHVISLIDLQNVLAVDVQYLKQMGLQGSEQPLISQFEDCPVNNASACPVPIFSRHDLCSHWLADYNYYVICRNILSPSHANQEPGCKGGLLHDIPKHIDDRYGLSQMLDDCANPPNREISLDSSSANRNRPGDSLEGGLFRIEQSEKLLVNMRRLLSELTSKEL